MAPLNEWASAIDACRRLAGALWRRERRLESLSLAGLNSEYAVRKRLIGLAERLQHLEGLPQAGVRRLKRTRFIKGTPFSILEATESLVEILVKSPVQDAVMLLRDPQPEIAIIAEMLVVQCVAARLGWWSPRGEETKDAHLAQSRYREVEKPDWLRYRSLLTEMRERFALGDFETVVKSAFHADRIVRTPSVLLTAAEALRILGEDEAALWACRACLLEPLPTFEGAPEYKKAERLLGRIKEAVDLSRPVPIDTGEAAILAEAFFFDSADDPWDERYIEEVAKDPRALRFDSRAQLLMEEEVRLEALDLLETVAQMRSQSAIEDDVFMEPPRLISQTYDATFPSLGGYDRDGEEAETVFGVKDCSELEALVTETGTFELPDFGELPTTFLARVALKKKRQPKLKPKAKLKSKAKLVRSKARARRTSSWAG